MKNKKPGVFLTRVLSIRPFGSPDRRAALFGFGLFLLFVVVKLAQLAVAVRSGWLGPLAGHKLWRICLGFPGLFVADGVVALVVAFLYARLPGGNKVVVQGGDGAPERGWPSSGVGAGKAKSTWPARLSSNLIGLVQLGLIVFSVGSIPFYKLYMKPLGYAQIQMMGSLSDFQSSFHESFDPLVVGVLVGALLLALVIPAVLYRFTSGFMGRATIKSLCSRFVFPLVAGVMMVSWVFLPGGGMAGLELNPLWEFVTSTARWHMEGGRSADRVSVSIDSRFPRFPVERIYDGDTGVVHGAGGVAAEGAAEGAASPVPYDSSLLPLKKPNVVLVVLESTSTRKIALYGGDDRSMPWLASRKDEALIFDNYYCITPVSMKSLFSIHCSLNPVTSPKAITYIHPNISCNSISQVMKGQGYHTALFHAGNFHYTDKDRFFKNRGYDVLRDADLLKNGRKYPKGGWGADDRAMGDDAVEWLGKLHREKRLHGQIPGVGKVGGRNKQAPFFLTLIPVSPHYPYQVPRGVATPFGDGDVEAKYLNAVHYVDSVLARVDAQIKEMGQDDDTLWIIVGDHGQAFGEHPGNRLHGSFIYDESMKVPMVLLHRGLFKGGRSDRIGNHLDLAPTLLHLLGLPPDPLYEGQSLLLEDREPRLIYFYTRFSRYQLGLRDGRWKYIHDMDTGLDELFDLLEDPDEKVNLASHQGHMVGSYRSRVREYESFYQKVIPAFESYYGDLPACLVQGAGSVKGGGKGRRGAKSSAVCRMDELEPGLVHGKFRKGRSVQGSPLSVAGKKYPRGVGVQAPSIVRYNIAGYGFTSIQGLVGKDDNIEAFQLEEVVSTEIYVDDVLVFASGKLTKGDDPVSFRIPLDEQAAKVEFFSHDLDGVAFRDNVNWINVRFIKD